MEREILDELKTLNENVKALLLELRAQKQVVFMQQPPSMAPYTTPVSPFPSPYIPYPPTPGTPWCGGNY